MENLEGRDTAVTLRLENLYFIFSLFLSCWIDLNNWFAGTWRTKCLRALPTGFLVHAQWFCHCEITSGGLTIASSTTGDKKHLGSVPNRCDNGPNRPSVPFSPIFWRHSTESFISQRVFHFQRVFNWWIVMGGVKFPILQFFILVKPWITWKFRKFSRNRFNQIISSAPFSRNLLPFL